MEPTRSKALHRLEAVLSHVRAAEHRKTNEERCSGQAATHPEPNVRRIVRPPFQVKSSTGRLMWVLSRHEDIRNLLKRDLRQHIFTVEEKPLLELPKKSAPEKYGIVNEAFNSMVLFRDLPRHRELRGILQPYFTAGKVQTYRPIVEEFLQELLNSVEERYAATRSFDLVREIARPLPCLVMSRLLGLPKNDIPLLVRFAHEFSIGINGISTPLEERMNNLSRLVPAYRQYFFDLVDKIRADSTIRPRGLIDDLLALYNSANKANLTLEMIADIMLMIFFAGSDTTSLLIGAATFGLLNHPEQLALFLQSPTHNAQIVVEEILRLYSPVYMIIRAMAKDVELDDGTKLRQHDIVLLNVGAANNDPSRYDNPSQLDWTAHTGLEEGGPGGGHLAFGQGMHMCLGRFLARLEVRMVLIALFERWPTLKFAPGKDVEWDYDNSVAMGPTRLEVAW